MGTPNTSGSGHLGLTPNSRYPWWWRYQATWLEGRSGLAERPTTAITLVSSSSWRSSSSVTGRSPASAACPSHGSQRVAGLTAEAAVAVAGRAGVVGLGAAVGGRVGRHRA